MPAFAASSDVRGLFIATIFANCEYQVKRKIRNMLDAFAQPLSHNANIMDDENKNGGPNHLGAWMRYRGVKGTALAQALDITPGMVSDLVNSNRALSAKWLRRLAPVLHTTPGHLLDHDPTELPTDIVEIWLNATEEERRQLVRVASAIVRDGTNG